jgi:hypothetical protein
LPPATSRLAPRHIRVPLVTALPRPDATGCPPSAPAPDKRLTLHAHLPPNPLSKTSTDNLKRRLSRRPVKAAVAAAAAVAGMTAGVAALAAPANAATIPGTASQPWTFGAPSSGIPFASPGASPLSAVAPQHAAAPARHAPVRVATATATKHQSAPHPRSPEGQAPRHAAAAQHHAAVRREWRRKEAAHPRHVGPYLIYDSVTPTAIPSHHAIATYATGPYAASSADVAGRYTVLWIDTNGSDPHASALDVEPGDATPSMAASWARAKLSANPRSVAIIYTMQSEWPAAQAAIGSLPAQMRSHVRWWIADPTGSPHVLPGANATQWYWGQNYDISTANPGF